MPMKPSQNILPLKNNLLVCEEKRQIHTLHMPKTVLRHGTFIFLYVFPCLTNRKLFGCVVSFAFYHSRVNWGIQCNTELISLCPDAWRQPSEFSEVS